MNDPITTTVYKYANVRPNNNNRIQMYKRDTCLRRGGYLILNVCLYKIFFAYSAQIIVNRKFSLDNISFYYYTYRSTSQGHLLQ